VILYSDLFRKFERQSWEMVFLCWAGHAVEVNNQFYLVPVDGNIEHVEQTCVNLSALLDLLSRLDAKNRIVIFDVCRTQMGGRAARRALPPSLAIQAAKFQGVILSSCDAGQQSYEVRSLRGGAYTHYFIEALEAAIKDIEAGHRVPILDAHAYAEQKVIALARASGIVQQPRILVQNSSTIFIDSSLTSGAGAKESHIAGSEMRTRAIVQHLDYLLSVLGRNALRKFVVRIRARRSSFAIASKENPAITEPMLHKQLLTERDSLIRLIKRGASLRMMLCWSLEEQLRWGSDPAQIRHAKARLTQLKRFCKMLLAKESLVERATIVRVPFPDRNMFIFGDAVLFEGRRLSVLGEFERTEVRTDKSAVKLEIESFDAYFADAIAHVCKQRSLTVGTKLNRSLLETLVEDIDQDVATLDARLKRRS
jgi:hypothetical protein